MGKIIVITGASSGMGKSLKSLYSNNGDIVINLSRTYILNENETNIVCDVRNEEDVKEAFLQIQKIFGKVDVLINNAGYGVNGAMEMVESEQFMDMLKVNVFGVYLCSKYALPLMSKGAKIINICSVQSMFPMPFRGVYSMSKAAALSLSYTQYMELKDCGIDVVAICPGEIATNFSKNRVRNLQTNKRYGDKIERSLVTQLDGQEKGRMPVEVASKKIYDIINKKRCSPFKIVGTKYVLLNFVFRFVPVKAQLYLIEKLFGGH